MLNEVSIDGKLTFCEGENESKDKTMRESFDLNMTVCRLSVVDKTTNPMGCSTEM